MFIIIMIRIILNNSLVLKKKLGLTTLEFLDLREQITSHGFPCFTCQAKEVISRSPAGVLIRRDLKKKKNHSMSREQEQGADKLRGYTINLDYTKNQALPSPHRCILACEHVFSPKAGFHDVIGLLHCTITHHSAWRGPSQGRWHPCANGDVGRQTFF